jgi:hypothetical protein
MQHLRRVASWLVAGAAAATSVSAVPATPSQVLFDCRDDNWAVELVGTADQRLILFTRPLKGGGRMGNAQSSWDEVREGHVIGQGGGHQRHIRLFDGVRQIILLEGLDGSLASRPGRTYAGALTITPTNPAQDFRIDCPASQINTSLVANVTGWAERVGASRPRAEDEGGPFDAWF